MILLDLKSYLSLVYTCVCILNHFSHVRLFVTPWSVACQPPLSMEFFQARILEWVTIPSSRDISKEMQANIYEALAADHPLYIHSPLISFHPHNYSRGSGLSSKRKLRTREI